MTCQIWYVLGGGCCLLWRTSAAMLRIQAGQAWHMHCNGQHWYCLTGNLLHQLIRLSNNEVRDSNGRVLVAPRLSDGVKYPWPGQLACWCLVWTRCSILWGLALTGAVSPLKTSTVALSICQSTRCIGIGRIRCKICQ